MLDQLAEPGAITPQAGDGRRRYTWTRVPGTDLEVRALTDKPLALRYRPQTRPRSLMPRVGANVVRRPCRRRRGRYSPLPSSTRSAQAKCGCPETVWPINQYRWLGVQVG